MAQKRDQDMCERGDSREGRDSEAEQSKQIRELLDANELKDRRSVDRLARGLIRRRRRIQIGLSVGPPGLEPGTDGL